MSTRMKSIVLVASPPTPAEVTVDGVRLTPEWSQKGYIAGFMGGSDESRGTLVLRDVPSGAHRVEVSGGGQTQIFEGDFVESIEDDVDRLDIARGYWPRSLVLSVLYFENIRVVVTPDSATAESGTASVANFRVAVEQIGGPAPFDVSLSTRGDLASRGIVATFERSTIRGGSSTGLSLRIPATAQPGEVSFEVVARARGGGEGHLGIDYEDASTVSLAIRAGSARPPESEAHDEPPSPEPASPEPASTEEPHEIVTTPSAEEPRETAGVSKPLIVLAVVAAAALVYLVVKEREERSGGRELEGGDDEDPEVELDEPDEDEVPARPNPSSRTRKRRAKRAARGKR